VQADTGPSLQERYAAAHRCFGCGPANAQGLRLRSFPRGDGPDAEVVAVWTPEPHHQAFEGVLSGGIVGTLLDCHSNWTAAWHLMRRDGLSAPPVTVTGEYHVRLLRPTPTAGALHLSARAVESRGGRVKIEARLLYEDQVTATCTGQFFAVKPDHPAAGRW